jgi:hypothetical protein
MLITSSLMAQGRKEEIKEKIESKKIAFLTDHMDLSPEESQQFWPLYNEYNDENEIINMPVKDGARDLSSDQKLSMLIDLEQKKLNLKKKYINKFKSVVGAEKTLQFFQFEREFRGKMLREIGEKRTKMRSRGN